MHPASIPRRDFLEAAGAVGIAAVLSRPDARGASASVVLGGEKPFVDLAIATICTDGFGNRHHEPAFRLIPEIGIRNVEFNLWFPPGGLVRA